MDWLLYGSGHVYGLALNGEDSVSFKRDDLHREIERHYANGISQQQQYDQVGRLILQNIEKDHKAGYQNQNANAQTQTKALLKRLYHYDKVGQLTDIHDKRRGHIEYKYDPVGRLLQANSSLGRETFAFDPASNIINPNKTNQYQKQDTYYEPTHKLGYNSLVGNVVKDYFDQKYQYDDYGQLIRQMDGGHIQYFEWDALGRLIRSKNDKVETHYRYDALGRRIEKSKKDLLSRGYSETTQYGWDGDTLAFESGNQYTKHYVYEMGRFVPLIQATYRQQMNQHQTPQWEHGYDYDKDPLWHTTQKVEKFDRVWFYHCDHLGTPQEMSDQTGAIVWTAEYKAWGECKPENHLKRDIWDSEIITNNIRFQGQYYDDETGLHYNRYRYYSPYVGRFISKDPIGLLGGLNTFAYAPNPIEWIDPLGLLVTPTYTRGANGRVERVQATILKSDLDSGTSTNESSRAEAKRMGKCNKVHAGHLLAKRLGGSGGVGHIFPQTPSINTGTYRVYEGRIYNDVVKNGSAKVDIKFIYPNATSKMPSAIMYEYESGGKKIMVPFANPNPCK
ncbi:RHS repeat-associated core domain-containing protein [Acinetobacter gerneri]|uniref:RHS repeat-associated core domain-containing protein n=1 Tax=Acinetobacter gerneri TaxID=202952 RepID=UPI003C6C036D